MQLTYCWIQLMEVYDCNCNNPTCFGNCVVYVYQHILRDTLASALHILTKLVSYCDLTRMAFRVEENPKNNKIFRSLPS